MTHGLESRYSPGTAMEYDSINAQERDVLVNATGVDEGNAMFTPNTDVLSADTLYVELKRTKRIIYGVGVVCLILGIILGILVGISIRLENHMTNLEQQQLDDMERIILRVTKSEKLLDVVCKAEFGQTSTLCGYKINQS
jgi:hypothetical protein